MPMGQDRFLMCPEKRFEFYFCKGIHPGMITKLQENIPILQVASGTFFVHKLAALPHVVFSCTKYLGSNKKIIQGAGR